MYQLKFIIINCKHILVNKNSKCNNWRKFFDILMAKSFLSDIDKQQKFYNIQKKTKEMIELVILFKKCPF